MIAIGPTNTCTCNKTCACPTDLTTCACGPTRIRGEGCTPAPTAGEAAACICAS